MSTCTALPQHDLETLCAEHMSWARALLRKKFGPQAEEHAGAGLFEAARTFDDSKGVPFRAWASRVLVWTASRAYRQDRAHDADYELLDGDEEASTPPMEASTLEERESFIQCLKRIDQMVAPARWVVLSRFIGQMRNKDIAQILDRQRRSIPRLMAELRSASSHKPRSENVLDGLALEGDEKRGPAGQGNNAMLFGSLDDLTDAAMLFGGQIVANAEGVAMSRLALGRAKSRWASLAWAVVTLERNGLRMRPTMGGEQLIFRTQAMSLLAGSMRRWYGEDGRCLPAGLHLDRRKLAFWLVDALGRQGGVVRLSQPRTTKQQAGQLADQVCELTAALAEPIELRQGWGVEVAADQREALEAFMEPLAPGKTWRAPTP